MIWVLSHLLMEQVKADTVLIESDMVARAILDVIPILNIRKLILEVNKSRYFCLNVKLNSSTTQHIQVFFFHYFLEIIRKLKSRGENLSNYRWNPSHPDREVSETSNCR